MVPAAWHVPPERLRGCHVNLFLNMLLFVCLFGWLVGLFVGLFVGLLLFLGSMLVFCSLFVVVFFGGVKPVKLQISVDIDHADHALAAISVSARVFTHFTGGDFL